MKFVRVDFLPPSRWKAFALLVFLAISVAVCAYEGWQCWVLYGAIRHSQIELSNLARKEAQLDADRTRSADLPSAPPYAKDALAIGGLARAAPGRVLASMESACVLGVKVLAFEFSASDASARIDLDVSNANALMPYLEAINRGHDRPRWELTQFQPPTGSGVGSATLLLKHVDRFSEVRRDSDCSVRKGLREPGRPPGAVISREGRHPR